jgi:hypothetical protein
LGALVFFFSPFQFKKKKKLELEVINKSNNQAHTVLDMVMDLLNGHLHVIDEHLYTSTLGSTNW